MRINIDMNAGTAIHIYIYMCVCYHFPCRVGKKKTINQKSDSCCYLEKSDAKSKKTLKYGDLIFLISALFIYCGYAMTI